jgi:hypothetical protein
MQDPSLPRILEAIGARCDYLQLRLGTARVARLVNCLLEGCPQVEAVLTAWVLGVAAEHTHDPEVLQAVGILLKLFLAEASLLKRKDLSSLRAFRYDWIQRCAARLGQPLDRLVMLKGQIREPKKRSSISAIKASFRASFRASLRGSLKLNLKGSFKGSPEQTPSPDSGKANQGRALAIYRRNSVSSYRRNSVLASRSPPTKNVFLQGSWDEFV